MAPSIISGLVTAPIQNAITVPTTAESPVGANIIIPNSAIANSGGTGLLPAFFGGAVTLDAQPVSSVSGSGTATAGTAPILPASLYDTRTSIYPLVFDAYTGFVIQTTMPGASNSNQTFQYSFTIQWEELVPASVY
jgi:hypothetical protein